jgi:hypothetical protein
MRLTIAVSLIFAGFAIGQGRKHFMTAPMSGGRNVSMAANNISRSGQYPASIQLTGEVEIKTPACLPLGKGGKLICGGEMIVRSDQATYHEDSGQIDAKGSVTIVPPVAR